ncbi:MAG: NUDIX hydrolase [bacterium]|nr:NUDIX hydrolase [bacterium]
MAFLEDISGFYGTGEKNRQGQSLEEFLKEYNPKKYDCPSNTTDIVVLRSRDSLQRWGQPLQVLMVKRSNHPSIGFWATPGGFVEMREDLYEGAARELEEETGVKNLPLKQMRTWGAWKRDPRWRVITTSFLALVEGELPVKAGDDAAEALWFDVKLTKEAKRLEEKAEIWRLELRNAEKGIRLWARVGIYQKGIPLLMEENYELLECEGIAVDHACILTQALLYVKERLLP